MRNRWSVFLALALLSLSSGCITAQFAKPTASFQKSAAETASAVGDYYRSRNKFERDLYLTDLAADPTKDLLAIDKTGSRTPLLGKFSPDAIQARLDSLDLINAYATRLVDLASSDKPAKFVDASEVLGKNLTGLETTWQKVSKGDAGGSKYIGPVSTLVGVVGQMVLEAKREEALKLAISAGDPEVRTILGFLRDDLVTLSQLEETGMKEQLATALEAYNSQRAKVSQVDRRAALTEIGAITARYEACVDNSPAELVNSMLKAHAALVRFAQSKQRPKDLAEMTSALDAFAVRAQRVADAINQLRSGGR